MRKKWFIAIMCSFFLVALSGCDQMGEILDKLSVFLDEKLDEDDSIEVAKGDIEEDAKENSGNSSTDTGESSDVAENGAGMKTDNTEEGGSGNGMSDGHENDADPALSFEERLALGGYSRLDPPNGLPIPHPDDWVLVEILKDDVAWEGVFCFDTPLEENIEAVEDSLRRLGANVISDPIEGYDNKHSTKYSLINAYEDWEGDMVYFVDIYGTTCSKVYYTANY